MVVPSCMQEVAACKWPPCEQLQGHPGSLFELAVSYPTYRSALGIMVYTSSATSSGWFFLKPFTWEVGRDEHAFADAHVTVATAPEPCTCRPQALRCVRLSAQVWLAIAITIIAIPCFTFLTEFLSIEVGTRLAALVLLRRAP